MYLYMYIYIYIYVCVCVYLYTSTVKASLSATMSRTYLRVRINDLVLSVEGIILDTSAKSLHLSF